MNILGLISNGGQVKRVFSVLNNRFFFLKHKEVISKQLSVLAFKKPVIH